MLCYNSEGRWFEPSWCQWIFHWHKSLRSHYGPGVDSASNRNEYQQHFLGGKGGRCVRLTIYHHPMPLSRNLGTLTSWNPLGHFRPVTGLLYLYFLPFYVLRNIFRLNFKRRFPAITLEILILNLTLHISAHFTCHFPTVSTKIVGSKRDFPILLPQLLIQNLAFRLSDRCFRHADWLSRGLALCFCPGTLQLNIFSLKFARNKRHRLLTSLCCAALKGCYVLLIIRQLPTFRDSISVPSYESGCP